MWELSHPRALWPRYLYHMTPATTVPETQNLMAPAPISTLSTSSNQPSDRDEWYHEDWSLPTFPASLNTFLNMLADHIDWRNPANTPSWFLSTFSDPEEVKRRLETEGGTVTKIDTGKLEAKVRLFSMETMRKLFLFEGETVAGEVLFFAMIPEQAVVGVVGVGKDGGDGKCCSPPFDGREVMGDGLTDSVAETDLSSFFAADENTVTGENAVDENLDDSQAALRAEMLGADEVYFGSHVYYFGGLVSFLSPGNGIPTSERVFRVPVTVSRYFLSIDV